MLTDKNDGLRTETKDLPLEASSRLVIPGYKVKENLEGLIRRDAPTGSRNSQHALFVLAGCRPKWRLAKGDVRAAFLKGDPYMAKGGKLYMSPPDEKRGPRIPCRSDCLCEVLKGVFGLADAPRQWFLRLDRCLREHGWESLSVDAATWVLRKGKEIIGMIVGHVDDLLLTGDEVAWEGFLGISRELGFGSLEENDFVWCGNASVETS